ncbi:O(6)-methylguanine-induced apoptosis 2-like [Lingula anatina]|uniref:O(6)-methylguanine-induced apoptosis 2-like n=1 Tax=Lingula anatina TaxID=7574 RepID=A0A1S3K3B7_LINAN|nr:O(6)-methylguanine-induced apoptosis 2-like [Lingula anatina]|eukprot:XP_013417017.1 O(6)-methylguanine-induced apoptosis 2-like [Lingula anatina]
MALDSLRDVDNSYVSRIHSRRTSGKLHKGNSIAAPNASIPSRYQTIITDNSDRKGFLSKAKRFNHEAIIDDNPGPGTYVNQTKTETVSTSFSKRGTGGFASKSKREQKVGPTPGPGSAAYQLPSLLQSKKDFNNAYTRVFHKPIAQPVAKLSAVPAPNEYEVLRYKPGKANNVSAQAAFKSQSKREVMDTKESAKKPAPWQYHVDDKLLRDSIKVPFSSFKSTSKRQMAPDPPPYPGPGTYKPHEAVEESANKLILP